MRWPLEREVLADVLPVAGDAVQRGAGGGSVLSRGWSAAPSATRRRLDHLVRQDLLE